jgi:thiamine biosynthesis protein ThiS
MKQKIFYQTILLNEEYYQLQSYELLSLKDLLFYLSYQPSLMVLEHNGKILNKKYWSLTRLHHLDKLETITIVGGG